MNVEAADVKAMADELGYSWSHVWQALRRPDPPEKKKATLLRRFGTKLQGKHMRQLNKDGGGDKDPINNLYNTELTDKKSVDDKSKNSNRKRDNKTRKSLKFEAESKEENKGAILTENPTSYYDGFVAKGQAFFKSSNIWKRRYQCLGRNEDEMCSFTMWYRAIVRTLLPQSIKGIYTPTLEPSTAELIESPEG